MWSDMRNTDESCHRIVIPIRAGGRLAGVLDIDSPLLSRFDERDRECLEKLTEPLPRKVRWDFSSL